MAPQNAASGPPTCRGPLLSLSTAALTAVLSVSLTMAGAVPASAAQASAPLPSPSVAASEGDGEPVELGKAAAGEVPDPAAVEAQLPDGPSNPEAEVHSAVEEVTAQAVATLELDPAEVTVLGATWDGTDPAAEYRAKVDGEWSEWQELPEEETPGGHDQEEQAAQAPGSSAPLALTEATAVEARATNPDFSSELELVAYSSPVTDVDREITEGKGGPESSTPSSAGSPEAPAAKPPAEPSASAPTPANEGAQQTASPAASEPARTEPGGGQPSPSSPPDADGSTGSSAEPGTSPTAAATGAAALQTLAVERTAVQTATTSSTSVLNRVITRSSWGAATPVCDLGNSKRKYATIVHHTAGTNSYTVSQVPGILRGIQRYHMAKDPTWCDIGYHMLVDKWGNIYEGRGGGLGVSRIATHAAGWNGDTFGVSVMGDYTTTRPSSAVVRSLQQIAGWQAAYWGYDPTGSVRLVAGRGSQKHDDGATVTLPRVFGHRDVGYTTCPGLIYGYLGSVRTGAKSWMPNEAAGQTGVGAYRIAGDDRYRTAVAASRQAYPSGAGTVYVATGADYADALVAAPAAARQNAPLLLTRPGGLPSPVAAEIDRLNPRKIVVVGGSGAVSATVASQLKRYTSNVVRHGGDNRYSTAAKVVRGAFPSASRAYIATGLDYPDALAASALAGSYGAIVMLVPGKNSTANTETQRVLSGLGVDKAVIVGGPAVVSRGIASSLSAYSPSRVFGSDRYETAQKLNSGLVNHASRVYFATGRDFPDALAAAAIAGTRRAPLYLSHPTCVPLGIRTDVVESDVATATLVGGEGVLTNAVGRMSPCY
ncbi:hypothetical protein GCM10022377_01830 [Zhihengliuella alba]|uniref:Peptidoglycan recognition protein family domain-containing protein n=1 Tax=Zhihengliuella alba TaxID=547018 RepID=A0ABP7CLS2_9MICC